MTQSSVVPGPPQWKSRIGILEREGGGVRGGGGGGGCLLALRGLLAQVSRALAAAPYYGNVMVFGLECERGDEAKGEEEEDG